MNWYKDPRDNVYKRVKGREVAHKHGEFFKCMEQITDEPFVPERFWADCVCQKVEHFEEAVEQCICSKHIKQLCILMHKPSKKRVQVGCVCVKKDCSEALKKEINLGIKQAKSGNKLCSGCDKYVLPADTEEYKTVCKSCYKLGARKRKCTTCNTYCINKYDPIWKTRCLKCYRAK